MSIPGDSPLTESSRKHHTNVGLMTQTNDTETLTQMAPSFQLEDHSQKVNEEFQPQMTKAFRALEQHAHDAVKEHGRESEQETAMWTMAFELGLKDVSKQQIEDYLTSARQAFNAPSIAANVTRGGQRFTAKRVPEVVPCLLKQGALHVLNAEQGTGKSNFCLALFRALRQEQPAKFLDLNIDCSKNWTLYLIGVDMPKELWHEPLSNYCLMNAVSETPDGELTGTLDEGVALIACSDTPYTLGSEHIAEFRQMALNGVARGERPLFVFDSYRSLASSVVSCGENDAKFADPLQELYTAMAGTGATTIVLHHTAKGKSQSTQSSGVGTSRLGSIPDVVLEMQAESRDSRRIVLSSSKRITHCSLYIQQHYSEGHWESFGDASDWTNKQQRIKEAAALGGRRLELYVKALEEWENHRRGFTRDQAANWLSITPQGAGVHLNLLHSKNLLIKFGDVATRGRFQSVFYPSEAAEVLLVQPGEALTKDSESQRKKDGDSDFPCGAAVLDPYEREESRERNSGGEAKKQGLSEASEAFVRAPGQIIPCHPIGTAVEYNGKNGWKVVEANLASGMHVIEKNGLRHKNLRMMDLPIHIDEEEEL